MRSGECQDGQNNRAAQVSIEKEKERMEFVRAWLDLGEHVQATQPDWLSPSGNHVRTPEQEFITIFVDQSAAAAANRSYQFGGKQRSGVLINPVLDADLLIGGPTYTLCSEWSTWRIR